MKTILNSAAFGTVLLVSSAGLAQEDNTQFLTAVEITELVSGNTLSGVFGEHETRYAQRNHANGLAVIHVEGQPIRIAPWFVQGSDLYCEDWGKDGVLCYRIRKDPSTGERRFVYPDGSLSPVINVQTGFQSITFE